MLTARLAAPAAALAVTLLALAVTGCSGAASSSVMARQAVTTASQAGCSIRQRDFVSAASLPSYTEFLSLGKTALPVQSQINHPLSFQRQYACGEFEGFVTNLALTGTYRQQNNARARQLGYTLGKWPLVPLTGPIVAQQAHRVLEIYEGVYEFASPTSAAAFLRTESGGSQAGIVAGLARAVAAHPLSVRPAAGAVVTERLLGPQRSSDEHAIYTGLQIKDFAITLSFQGGQALTWRDVTPYWDTVRSRLTAIDNRR